MLHNIYFMGAIVPCVMFFCGCMMYRMWLKPNNFAGYRTGMSMRNEDTWQFANRYSGLLWMKWSVPLLAVSESLLYLWQPNAGTAEGLMLLQLIPVVAVIPVTERALNKTFDWHGNRREGK